ESLAAGTPALISDQTPWRDFEKYGAGWVLPLNNMNNFIDCIESFYAADPEEKHLKRKKAREYAVNVNKNSITLKANQALFLRAL
ncbi:MAG: glycosyltransferase, partial [Candidatus Cloacimonetes bacterium]|nr:glycosyltransferase [Candidatus Cloacimonadota bacterium]MDY0230422.1 hypothetical protein [Candidatus Cloacimonadaceae bacterium]